MRFVFAIVAFVIAAVMIGTGIAQRTIFLPPKEVVASVSIDSTAPVTVIDSATLRAFPGNQHLQLAGSDKAFAAFGRTEDVKAWVGNASYNLVSYDKTTKQLTSKLVEKSSSAETTVPDPAGSDLWLAEYEDPLASGPYTYVKSKDISFLIVSDGTAPAPSSVKLSWPLDGTTPWATPLMLGGAAILLLGLGLLIWAITHVRRARGPRRRSPKMPKLPKQPKYRPSKARKALPTTTSPRGRRSTRLTMIALPLTLAGAVALTGCSSPAITPSADAAQPQSQSQAKAKAAAATLQAPAVTELQAGRIVTRIAEVAAKADKDLDASAAEARFAGPALALRKANYAIRKSDSTEDAVDPIQTHVSIVLPQQNDTWPRTVFVVVDKADDTSVAPIALMLIQDDPRSQYKVHYAMNLEPGIVLPDVAGATVGTNQLPADNAFLALAPASIATAYGDILSKDTASASYDAFEETNDSLRLAVGLAAQKKAQKKLPKTAKLTFSNAPGTEDPIVLATLDNGAIVATELDETQTVKPVESGAAVNAPKSIKALSGKAVSSTGITAVYGDQLLFYVPANTVEGGKIQLLGYSQGLISASELKKK